MQGIFPWFNEDEPVLWWSPDPRFVLFPEELHIPKVYGVCLIRKFLPFLWTKLLRMLFYLVLLQKDKGKAAHGLIPK